jgi:hypothetical protein
MRAQQTILSLIQRLLQILSRLRQKRADHEGCARFLKDSIVERRRYEQARRKGTEFT